MSQARERSTIHRLGKNLPLRLNSYRNINAKAQFAEIVLEHGIDPGILGANRVNGLKIMVLKEVKVGKGFRDLNTYGTYLEHLLTPEAKIRLLEQDLAYKD